MSLKFKIIINKIPAGNLAITYGVNKKSYDTREGGDFKNLLQKYTKNPYQSSGKVLKNFNIKCKKMNQILKIFNRVLQ